MTNIFDELREEIEDNNYGNIEYQPIPDLEIAGMIDAVDPRDYKFRIMASSSAVRVEIKNVKPGVEIHFTIFTHVRDIRYEIKKGDISEFSDVGWREQDTIARIILRKFREKCSHPAPRFI